MFDYVLFIVLGFVLLPGLIASCGVMVLALLASKLIGAHPWIKNLLTPSGFLPAGFIIAQIFLVIATDQPLKNILIAFAWALLLGFGLGSLFQRSVAFLQSKFMKSP